MAGGKHSKAQAKAWELDDRAKLTFPTTSSKKN